MIKKESNMEEDILKEIINIHVGQAANLLSQIVDKKVELEVPKLKVIDKEKKIESSEMPDFLKGALMISRLKFENELNGKAELIFSAEHIKELIYLCTGEEPINFNGLEEFTDADFDVIKEIGNIILNAVIGGIGNFLDLKVDYSMLEVNFFETIDIKKIINSNSKYSMLMLFVKFKIENTEINGALVVTFTIDTMLDLKVRLRGIEEELGEG